VKGSESHVAPSDTAKSDTHKVSDTGREHIIIECAFSPRM
jgi:hypothetical protein